MQSLIFKLLSVTEAAALASYKCLGMGNEKEADRVAVHAMRKSLNLLEINGTVVIGEGERDNAPMLYIGEKVGIGGIDVDIALDPLEGTTMCAHYKNGAMSVLAIAKKGEFLNAPDVYMKKIAVGPNVPKGVVSLKYDIKTNLYNLAEVRKCNVNELIVMVLYRERHLELIKSIRECGARIKLIDDGDVSAVVSLMKGTHDLYVGTGGAPEGVLAAAALSSMGGYMEGKLIFDTEYLRARAEQFGIKDINKIYSIEEMVKSESIFIATGITDSALVKGIRYSQGSFIIESIIIKPASVMYVNNTVPEV
ncbi:fructose-1,6-bisphosphatase, class II [Ehrlichia chaffeensis str. Heartland]|uniref:Fructose-1,6-bisphosphatase n=1 Tax=Ehrlichia chaffeensis (strain ATCC CRL-10679 / Arkansas) TaxID=205920 RepID=Q2GHA7_EHRCR|nr:class II fructose-bisphosphatase [Ehrlichia chaffeensis]ABD44920.1 fructose-1,6-bisphosphatase, class II [Ehrlichia chaffeensis str. Arkansas]AHX03469.1 fructose-1,6-bisphosphatase, class II [Ehrlichia chaffeensis str. Heartland]AHX05811.1 fructose-1,6-bisphosphatase, class II [Ehrlichia chaffeensis str. Jax]AHX06803.1 fructose-1,6-bisphosphatase, class II [Ehrlichia chaffeensis str. Liberty]AHX07508.1 fructose-1,6-bisphosphatase, class II [Ehrlichia chaffeensis str. Osceola]